MRQGPLAELRTRAEGRRAAPRPAAAPPEPAPPVELPAEEVFSIRNELAKFPKRDWRRILEEGATQAQIRQILGG